MTDLGYFLKLFSVPAINYIKYFWSERSAAGNMAGGRKEEIANNPDNENPIQGNLRKVWVLVGWRTKWPEILHAT